MKIRRNAAASWRRAFATITAALCASPVLGAGVTVITHGFNGNVTEWILPMAERIPGHPFFSGTGASCYELSITRNGSGQFLAAATLVGGLDPALTGSGEIFVKLDWSTLAGIGGASTTAVANAAANALLSPTLIPSLGGRPLAELPLHLAGHSRGGSVVTEMARFLGAQGVWVDHVTTLDPRPVSGFGDANVATWANVLFADNYWQTLGDGLFVPNGQSVSGAYNRRLTTLGGGYSSSHSDVHLWYHGTIELTTPATDTQANITTAERASWWTAAETGGSATGFRYSRIGGGDRLSSFEPAGAGNGRISDGFNKRWDLGGGTASNRAALPANSGLWPNVIRFALQGSGSVEAGGSFSTSLHHQSGAGTAGNVDVRILLDTDFNPLNGTFAETGRFQFANTGTAAVALNQSTSAIDAATVPPGNYAVCARISDGTRTRHHYAAQMLSVTPSTTALRIDAASLARTGGAFRFDVHAFPGQSVKVVATSDFVTWDTLETRTSTGAIWQFTDTSAGSFTERFYQARLGP